jgi:ech hydrogenase subunit F
MSFLHFAGTILDSLFSKPVTTTYPATPAVLKPELRGRVVIDIQKCISCGMCMRKCPAGAIIVDRPKKSWTIDRYACVQCATCVDNCPVKCLHMEPQYAEPITAKEGDTFVKVVPPAPAKPQAQVNAKPGN